MNNMKHNTKIKLISLLSSVFLWMYVMSVVDPEETKLIENIPINISNINELEEEGLLIYPEKDITADIYITGSLSRIQNVDVDDIKINGEIRNPIEGNNEIYLTIPTSYNVTYEFKDSIIIVELDKIIDERIDIDINVNGDIDNNVDVVKTEKETIKVTGPRTLVSKVDKIIGEIDLLNRTDSFTQSVNIKAVDERGDEVEGIELEEDLIEVNVSLLKQKTIPINILIEEDLENVDNIEYKSDENQVTIKGKVDIVDSIEYIDTDKLKLSDMKNNDINEVKLIIPEGIQSNITSVNVEIINSIATDTFIFNKEDIETRNNVDNISDDRIQIPDSIEVIVEYNSEIVDFNKEKISLYIDLQKLNDSNEVIIEYSTNYDLENISINPSTIVID